MSGSPRASILLATYEMPRHLELVFEALGAQSSLDFEVMLCDDGSGEETKKLVERYQAAAKFPITHLWQENQGFRKCRILNRAIRASRGSVMIFLDGDCVPHSDFVRDHLENQEPGRYLCGRRVNLGEAFSRTLTPAKIREGALKPWSGEFIRSAIFGETQNWNRSLRVPSPFLRKLFKMDRIDDLLGSNFSVSREDLFAINGFDESYEGYGREDTDVEIRLQNLGLKIKSMKGVAIQFHVWHPRRGFTPKNDALLDDARATKRVRAVRGLEPASS